MQQCGEKGMRVSCALWFQKIKHRCGFFHLSLKFASAKCILFTGNSAERNRRLVKA